MKNKKKEKEISNKVSLYDAKGKREGTFELDKKIFSGLFNPALIYQAVLMYQANKREGNASTKVRNDVSGGGKKPWKQKGTGRARVSSIRSPLWRGGGIIFGPHKKSFKYTLPKKIRRLAILHSLNSKLRDGLFGVIKELKIEDAKTRMLKNVIDKTGLEGSILLVTDSRDRNLALASRNIKSVNLKESADFNALDVLSHNNFLITEKAISDLTKRLRA